MRVDFSAYVTDAMINAVMYNKHINMCTSMLFSVIFFLSYL